MCERGINIIGPDAVASNEGPHVEGDDQEEVANEDDARSKQDAPTNLSRQAHSGALLPTCEVYGKAFHWLEGGHTGVQGASAPPQHSAPPLRSDPVDVHPTHQAEGSSRLPALDRYLISLWLC